MIGNWFVKAGFLTGTEIRPSWFALGVASDRVSVGMAVYLAKRAGYSISKDICADVIFYIENADTGKHLSPADCYDAEKDAAKILKQKIQEPDGK
jgi:hypothetical protein